MSVRQVVTGDKRANCYLFCDDTTHCCAVIDPGAMNEALWAAVEQAGRHSVAYILLTHCHYDHVGAAWELREMTGAPVAIYCDDAAGLRESLVNRTGAHGRQPIVYPPADILWQDGDSFAVGASTLTVLHTPGHTKGGCCYMTHGVLFTGDTLFRGTAGKTDLPGGDAAQLGQSMRRLAALEGEYEVYPGHGDHSLLSYERANNPYMLCHL